MFKDLTVKKETPPAAPRRSFIPAVDVRETPDALVLWADMPGVSEREVEVSLEGNTLTIEGRPSAEAPAGHAPVWR
jgi:HSP20 family protein